MGFFGAYWSTDILGNEYDNVHSSGRQMPFTGSRAPTVPARVLPKGQASTDYTRTEMTGTWWSVLVIVGLVLAVFIFIVAMDIL